MKKLDLHEMENVQGVVRFNPSWKCLFTVSMLGLSVAALASGPGAIAGLSMMGSLISSLTECFPYY